MSPCQKAFSLLFALKNIWKKRKKKEKKSHKQKALRKKNSLQY